MTYKETRKMKLKSLLRGVSVKTVTSRVRGRSSGRGYNKDDSEALFENNGCSDDLNSDYDSENEGDSSVSVNSSDSDSDDSDRKNGNTNRKNMFKSTMNSLSSAVSNRNLFQQVANNKKDDDRTDQQEGRMIKDNDDDDDDDDDDDGEEGKENKTDRRKGMKTKKSTRNKSTRLKKAAKLKSTIVNSLSRRNLFQPQGAEDKDESDQNLSLIHI